MEKKGAELSIACSRVLSFRTREFSPQTPLPADPEAQAPRLLLPQIQESQPSAPFTPVKAGAGKQPSPYLPPPPPFEVPARPLRQNKRTRRAGTSILSVCPPRCSRLAVALPSLPTASWTAHLPPLKPGTFFEPGSSFTPGEAHPCPWPGVSQICSAAGSDALKRRRIPLAASLRPRLGLISFA